LSRSASPTKFESTPLLRESSGLGLPPCSPAAVEAGLGSHLGDDDDDDDEEDDDEGGGEDNVQDLEEERHSRSSSEIVSHTTPLRHRLKPPQPYPYIIAECILAAPEQRLTLRDLYLAIEERYPDYYGDATSESTSPTGSRILTPRPWQNTVRFNLSRSGIFTKVELQRECSSQGPGRRCSYWAIVEEWHQRIMRDGLSILLAMGDARKSRRVVAASSVASRYAHLANGSESFHPLPWNHAARGYWECRNERPECRRGGGYRAPGVWRSCESNWRYAPYTSTPSHRFPAVPSAHSISTASMASRSAGNPTLSSTRHRAAPAHFPQWSAPAMPPATSEHGKVNFPLAAIKSTHHRRSPAYLAERNEVGPSPPLRGASCGAAPSESSKKKSNHRLQISWLLN
jgi:hypothetical protein